MEIRKIGEIRLPERTTGKATRQRNEKSGPSLTKPSVSTVEKISKQICDFSTSLLDDQSRSLPTQDQRLLLKKITPRPVLALSHEVDFQRTGLPDLRTAPWRAPVESPRGEPFLLTFTDRISTMKGDVAGAVSHRVPATE